MSGLLMIAVIILICGLGLLYSLLVRPKFEVWQGTISSMSGLSRPINHEIWRYDEVWLATTRKEKPLYFGRWLVSDYLHGNGLIESGAQGTWFFGFLKHKPGSLYSSVRVFAFHDGMTLHYAPLAALKLCPYGAFYLLAIQAILVLTAFFSLFAFVTLDVSVAWLLPTAALCFVMLFCLWLGSVRYRAQRARKILERHIVSAFPNAL